MANERSIQDDNQIFALIAHSGTAIGADAGTIETRQVVASGGNLHVDVRSGTVAVAGTSSTSITGGTINVLQAGTVSIAGTVPVSGTVTTLKGLSIAPYDTVQISYPSGTTETYVFKSGGTAGATVATVNLIYTDSTKGSLSLVLKT